MGLANLAFLLERGKLQVYEALSYACMRPEATSVRGLKPLVHEALSYTWMRAECTSAGGLKLLVQEA